VQGLKFIAQRPGARDGVEIEAQAAARGETVLQLYLVRATAPSGPKQAVIISLITPTASLATQRSALDQVVATLGLNPLPEPAPAPAPRAAPGKPPSAAQRPAEEQRR
jgi:3-deoxy-D-manno-octulosonic-acid transferase